MTGFMNSDWLQIYRDPKALPFELRALIDGMAEEIKRLSGQQDGDAMTENDQMTKKYYWTQKWNAQRMTCAELVTILERQGGFPGCMGGRTFIEESGDEPVEISESWDWIQAQRGNKKLWVLSHDDTDGSLIDSEG